ncbi:Pentatricopeptide repeat-containing protein [Melia azedarach]|uniref:Pentatricopeptide repeat-containing protein n=1 Tax=Melia azedarach TaxID=155640 RepID=A0ACC1XQL7_MELAZ|nr:Pentatricopeptide repeat-containing protein [Melia azedarach]
MEFSNPLKKNLRYLSISNPCYFLNNLFSNSSQSILSSKLKTLVALRPSSFQILNLNQFHSKPTFHPSYSFSSSTGSYSLLHFNACNGYRSQKSKLELLTNRCVSSSAMVSGVRNYSVAQYASSKQVSEIIQLILSGDSEVGSKLESMNVSLSTASVIEIFRVLNSKKVSALRFFRWIREFQPEIFCNSDICSLVIDNCGRLDDYENMRHLLDEFSANQIQLTEKAFGFLPVMISSKSLTKVCIWRVVEVLNNVGGSCMVSGIRALIEMYSVLGSFQMAKYVIKKTGRKVSYYNILIREMCRRCDFKGARDMLDEMRQVSCEPSTQTYNYILGSLCKNGKDAEACGLFEEMQEKNCPPDAVTYEIFIYNSCRFGKFNIAYEFFDHMVVRGLEPRSSTHAAFIKGYFSFHQYEEAHKYVVLSADKFKSSSNMLYSLLASLHDKNNNPVMAKNVLLEMLENGLRPNFSVYRRVLKHLRTSGQEDMARYLTGRYSSLSLPSSMEAG